MAKPLLTPSKIASMTHQDIDEVLLSVWDYGFDYVSSVSTIIKPRDENKIREIFDLPTRKQERKKTFWMRKLFLSESEIKDIICDCGCLWNPKAENLPLIVGKRLLDTLIANLAAAKENEKARVTEPKVEVMVAPPPKLEWEIVGHEPSGVMRYLSAEEAKEFHYILVEDFKKHNDPIEPCGIKSDNLFESAIFRPQTAMGSDLKYESIEMAAAALIHSIIHNHPFHNGNKRTALVSMLAFLDANDLIFECPEKDLFKMVLKIAKHDVVNPHPYKRDDREVLGIARWIQRHSRKITKGERPIQWRKLRGILTNLGCEVGDRKGNKVDLSRQSDRKSMWGLLDNKIQLKTTAFSQTDGDEIDQESISRIRGDLELDEGHGVDSTIFYDVGEIIIDGFILKYRKTLHRLSKL